MLADDTGVGGAGDDQHPVGVLGQQRRNNVRKARHAGAGKIRLECNGAACAAKEAAEAFEPRCGEGVIIAVAEQCNAPQAALVIGVPGEAFSKLGHIWIDPQEQVVVGAQVAGRGGRAHHHRIAAAQGRDRRHAHLAEHMPDDGDAADVDQIAGHRGGAFCLPPIIAHYQLDPAPVDPAPLVDIVDRQDGAVATGVPEFGGTAAEAPRKADIDRLLRLARGKGQQR